MIEDIIKQNYIDYWHNSLKKEVDNSLKKLFKQYDGN